jgi:predicted amidohydrolase
VRIGCYQCASPAGDISKGLALIDGALAQASGDDIDMLVMPELFLPGYNAVTQTKPDGWDDVHTKLKQLCSTHGVALTIGLPNYTSNEIFNTAYAFDPDGRCLAKYRKVQLFGPREERIFKAGDQLCAFEYMGTTFGLLICYDIEFPEHVRALARAGASVVLTPTANMEPFINVCTTLVPARALENAISVAYANYTDREGDLTYVGHSVIAGPDGTALAAHGVGEGLITAQLPTQAEIPLSTQLVDYRPARSPSR